MTVKLIQRIVVAAALVVFFVGMGVSSASADDATIYLNTGNSGLAGTSGPYAKVELTLTAANTVTVTVTAANGFGLFGNGGGSGMFGFNGPAGLTITPITSGIGDIGGGHMDSFG